MAQPELDSLENSIVGAISTLDKLAEFTQPSENPNNHGLALNLHTLVEHLNQVASDSRQLDRPIPVDIVYGYVDKGLSPDEFMLRQEEHNQMLRNDVAGKKAALQQLAEVLQIDLTQSKVAVSKGADV